MPIRMITEKNHHRGKPDLTFPAIFCDECGARVTDHTKAAVFWYHPLPPREAEPDAYYQNEAEPIFLCKTTGCQGRWEADHGRPELWLDLAPFVIYLATQIGIRVKPPKDIQDALRLWSLT